MHLSHVHFCKNAANRFWSRPLELMMSQQQHANGEQRPKQIFYSHTHTQIQNQPATLSLTFQQVNLVKKQALQQVLRGCKQSHIFVTLADPDGAPTTPLQDQRTGSLGECTPPAPRQDLPEGDK